MAVTLTERAAQHILLHVMADKAVGLRFGVRPSGCSGLSYDLALAETIHPDDMVSESCGVKVLVSARCLPYVDGTQIDLAKVGLNQSFRFDNPNVKAACGCGESFAV
jgi:iron-sulfur cluster assembly protein